MKVGTLLLIAHDVVEKLVGMNLLTNEGEFVSSNLQQDLTVITMIENCIKARGITVQSEVDKIINILPLIAGLVK